MERNDFNQIFVNAWKRWTSEQHALLADSGHNSITSAWANVGLDWGNPENVFWTRAIETYGTIQTTMDELNRATGASGAGSAEGAGGANSTAGSGSASSAAGTDSAANSAAGGESGAAGAAGADRAAARVNDTTAAADGTAGAAGDAEGTTVEGGSTGPEARRTAEGSDGAAVDARGTMARAPVTTAFCGTAAAIAMRAQLRAMELGSSVRGRARAVETGHLSEQWSHVTAVRSLTGWCLLFDSGAMPETVATIEELVSRVPDRFTLSSEAADHAQRKRNLARDAQKLAAQTAVTAEARGREHFAAKEEAARAKVGLSPGSWQHAKKVLTAPSPLEWEGHVVYHVPGGDWRPFVARRFVRDACAKPLQDSADFARLKEERKEAKKAARKASGKRAAPSAVIQTFNAQYVNNAEKLRQLKAARDFAGEEAAAAAVSLDATAPAILADVVAAGDEIVKKVGVKKLVALLRWKKALPAGLKARNADAERLVDSWVGLRARMGEEEVTRIVATVNRDGGRGSKSAQGKGKGKAAAAGGSGRGGGSRTRGASGRGNNSRGDGGDGGDSDDDKGDDNGDDGDDGNDKGEGLAAPEAPRHGSGNDKLGDFTAHVSIAMRRSSE